MLKMAFFFRLFRQPIPFARRNLFKQKGNTEWLSAMVF
jgi:hypothetical protein